MATRLPLRSNRPSGAAVALGPYTARASARRAAACVAIPPDLRDLIGVRRKAGPQLAYRAIGVVEDLTSGIDAHRRAALEVVFWPGGLAGGARVAGMCEAGPERAHGFRRLGHSRAVSLQRRN